MSATTPFPIAKAAGPAPAALGGGLAPIPVVLVGTHHKTGTLWMRWVFRALAWKLNLPFGVGASLTDDSPARQILAHWSSSFAPDLLARADIRGLHMIRDPRDVLISGMRYHSRVSAEREPLLAEARDDLGGQSYLAHIASLPDDRARFLFEMDGMHAQTLAQMLAWDYGRDTMAEVRYEELITDETGAIFGDILHFLGFAPAQIAIGTEIFRDHSLFGPMTHQDRIGETLEMHIDSGAPARWRRDLPRDVAAIYAETYGQALVDLGYERHPTAWLSEVAP